MTPETVCPDCDNGRINVLPGCSVGGAWRKCSTCNGTGRIPAQGSEPTPPSAGEGDTNALQNQTPAGESGYKTTEGELDRLLAEHEGMDNCGDPACLSYQLRLQYLAAINAYIARRVLEVIGEDDPYAPGILGVRTRNQLRAEQRQRIAAINQDRLGGQEEPLPSITQKEAEE